MYPVAVAAAAVAACGVPSEHAARPLPTDPFGLITTTTAAPTTVPAPDGFRLTLYWVGPGDVIVPGMPIGLPEAPTFQTVLDLLVEGPGPVEPAGDPPDGQPPPGGLVTYVTESLHPAWRNDPAPGPVVERVDEATGIVDIAVADEFFDASSAQPQRFRLAIAQIVCTVTQFENARGVRLFDSRGQPITLVNLDTVPIEPPIGTRDNIGDCDPEPPPAEPAGDAASDDDGDTPVANPRR
jgi:hypothetical protein